MVAHKALLPHLLGPGHPGSETAWVLFGCSRGPGVEWGLEEVLARTGGKDPGREASSFTYLLVLGLSSPPHCLWDEVSLQHSLLAGSKPQTTAHSPLLQCQCPMKAR